MFLIIIAFVIICIIISNIQAENKLEALRKNFKSELQKNIELSMLISKKDKEISNLNYIINAMKTEIKLLKETINDSFSSFPSVLEAIRLYDEKRDKELALHLETKPHPALTSAQILRSQSERLRRTEEEYRKLRFKNEHLMHEIQRLIARPDVSQKELNELRTETEKVKESLTEKCVQNDNLCKQLQEARAEAEMFRKMLSEVPLGFPSLLEALKLYDAMKDRETSANLERKSKPALKAAEIVKIETQKRREAEYECRRVKFLLEYYFKNLLQEDDEIFQNNSAEYYPENSDEDMTAHYLSDDEYFSLSVTERNQLALDRFWKSSKSKQTIGKLYEQYVGWLYEKQGWIVEYFGINEGFSDLGRDLLCHKDITTLIIQCKNWSKSKSIHEKHIFQLFGTMYEYRKNHPFETVNGVFYTSTSLSDLARSFAGEFHIELHENFELKRFPVIKCNIGRGGERIYHLPFDQQYYNTKINAKDGDCYCLSVEEAEAKGFRRAYRWHGSK